jgi:hypothetical protein
VRKREEDVNWIQVAQTTGISENDGELRVP